ncbi:MAG: glucose-6-phosphate isomerase [Clostridia bacterium]|nr:glucose-6-phosphate isomerase [Clostridia bacterium]
MSIKLNCRYLEKFLSEADYQSIADEVTAAHSQLYENKASAAGNAYHGWLTLPEDYDKEEFARIKKAARKIRSDSKALVVIGIGGSYLGARAAIEFVKSKNYNLVEENGPKIFFTGNSISPTEISEILNYCRSCDFSVNVISKSGTTTEPAIAFRLFKKLLEEKYGKAEAAKRIYVTTDKAKGTLKALADSEGYEEFVVPDGVGGRYSVLTAVGLLPIAAAGVDIDALMNGAADAMRRYEKGDLYTNDCCRYAAIRNLLYRKGKKVEMMVSFEPDYTVMNEWFKQLFGESEGKDGKGIYPASAIYSTDLHSMGQYVQEGERILFETVVDFRHPKCDIVIEADDVNADGLNFLAGKTLSFVNKKAYQGTVLAHCDGDVPVIILEVDRPDAYNLGELFYFLEKTCAVSGYILGVNPFNQPGVESYKKNMFALIGKPGYEEMKQDLEKRIEE